MITIPKLSELYTDVLSDLETKFSISIPLFGKNFLRALASVQAGKLWIYYKAIGLTQKNIFADTADSELIGGTLERFGRIKIGRNPFPATAGQYSVSVTGSIGAIIPGASTFKSDDGSASPGILFVLDNDYTIVGGPNAITLRSLTAGLEAQLSISDTLTITSPVALIDDQGLVILELIEPLAAEDIEDYRTKVLAAYRLEAQGGAGADYRLWSFDVQGVQQAYPFATNNAAGEVNLFIEATIADSIDGKGTPPGAMLTAVEAAIEDPTAERPSRKPLTVFEVHYLPITPREIEIFITGYVGLDPVKQLAIDNALEESLSLVRPFVSSIDILADKNDIFGVNEIIGIIIEAVPGSQFGAVTMEVDGAPFISFTFEDGDIPDLINVDYV